MMALGHAAEMYTYGIQGWFTGIGTFMVYTVGPILLVPLFYPLQLTSGYEVTTNV